jgi:propionyl-CoA synthetase
MDHSCFDLLDRHVIAGRADDEAVRAGPTRWTYARLLEEASSFGGVLMHCGVVEEGRVLVALPESVEALVAVLGSARIGAVPRLVDVATLTAELEGEPATVLATAASETYVAAALDRAAAVPDVVLVKQRPGAEWELLEGRDYDWDVVMRAGRTAPAPCVEGATVATDDDRVRGWVETLRAGATVRLGS